MRGFDICVYGPELFKTQTSPLRRCQQLRTTGSCCTMGTMIILLWSSTKVTSRSAMTLAASQDTPSTGELPLRPRAFLSPSADGKMSNLLFSFGSTETINDGQFHTVELVTFDQMVNLSIDGGLPTTMDSFGAVRPLNGEAPLYVGGRGPLQNTPPSSAGTLNYYTTVNHPPSPLALSPLQPNPSTRPCNPLQPHPASTRTIPTFSHDCVSNSQRIKRQEPISP